MAVARYQILALDVDGTLLDRGWNTCARGQPPRWPAPPRPGFGRSFARAGAIDAPCPSPSSSGSTLPWFATRVPSSRTPRTIAPSGAPTSTTRSPPTCSISFAATTSPPSCSPTAAPTSMTSSSRRSRPDESTLMTTSVRTASTPRSTPTGRWSTASPNVSNPLFHICAIGTASEMLGFEQVAHRAIRRSRSDLRSAQSALSRHHVRVLAP